MAIQTLTVTKRDTVGTGKLNALRAQNLVPGIIYGAAVTENINVQVAVADLRQILKHEATDSFVLNLELDGKTILALVKDIQHNFLNDSTLHLDFLAVTEDTVVSTKVPVKLIGSAAGVAMGGVVHQIVNEMPVKCKVKDIPCCIQADIRNVQYKESLRLSQVELPANITTRFNGTVVLASVIKP